MVSFYATRIIALLEDLCTNFQPDYYVGAAVSPQLKQGVLAAMKVDNGTRESQVSAWEPQTAHEAVEVIGNRAVETHCDVSVRRRNDAPEYGRGGLGAALILSFEF